jgi:propionyl-CoA carboxylase alpha chain
VRLGESEIKLDIRRLDPAAVAQQSSKLRQSAGECNVAVVEVRFIEPAAGEAHLLSSAWLPGDPVWSGNMDGRPISVQVRPALNAFDLSHRGVETRAYVYTEREAAAARLMPVKKIIDAGKAVRCPMPGLVVSVAVGEGQEVKAGEALAVVEAMKMENVLRADRDGVIAKIYARQGDSLAVDAVILEFA